MADDVVRLSEQFVLVEAADFDKAGVDVGDAALGVRLRDDGLAFL